MIKLKNIKMKPKLISVFLLVGLLPLFLAGLWSSNLATEALMEKNYAQLESVRGIKKDQIERYFRERRGDMAVLVETVSTLRREAFGKLNAIQQIKMAQITDYFNRMKAQLRIVKDDPYVMNALVEFDAAFEAAGDRVQTMEWNLLAEKYDARLRDIVKDNGWYDLFLIHTDGDIVYTSARESDLGMVIPDSELKNQGLGKAFAAAGNMGPDEIAAADIAPYSPSGGKPAGFMMARMRDAGGLLRGYVAFQIPMDKINEIMLRRDGMGKTGESYLVGPDGLMRSDAFLDREGHSVVASFANNARVDTEATRQALAGKPGQEVIIDYNGNYVLSCWDPVNIGGGIRWAMMSEIDVAEAFSPADDEGNEYFARYQELYGYYDLFLINPDGFIFYTVVRESDYRTNIVTGKYAGSNLGRLVKEVIATKQFALADFEPYAPSNNEPAAFMAEPAVHEGKVDAVVALQISLDSINAIMQERTGMGKTGETYLVGSDKLMRSDSFLDPTHHSVAASFANPSRGSVDTAAAQAALAGQTGSDIIIDYNGNPVLSAFTPVSVGRTTWALLAEIDEAEVKAPIHNLIISVGAAALIIAVLVVLFALFIAKSIARPLEKGVDFTRSVSKGDLSVRIDVDQEDEVGMLAEAMNEMILRLREIVEQVKTAAGNVASGSQELASASEEMSQGSSEQASAAEEASASMEEMAANIRQNADNAAATEKIAMKSADDAGKGGAAVAQTLKAMKEIAEKINIVEEIARQTDLLALNAAIEAARAGDHGKGFAVVASEVRKLAERSQAAAVEIGKLSVSSVEVAENAGALLKEIVPDIQKTAELVQEISAACNEQTSGAGQINKALQQLDQVIQQNASASEEMASTSEELSGQAEQLQMTVEFFKLNGAQKAAAKKLKDPAKKASVRAKKTDRPRNAASGHVAGGPDAVLDIDDAAFKQTESDAEWEQY